MKLLLTFAKSNFFFTRETQVIKLNYCFFFNSDLILGWVFVIHWENAKISQFLVVKIQLCIPKIVPRVDIVFHWENFMEIQSG